LQTATVRLVLGHRFELDATLAVSWLFYCTQLDSCTENLCYQSMHESKLLHQLFQRDPSTQQIILVLEFHCYLR